MASSIKKILIWSVVAGIVIATGFTFWEGRRTGPKVFRPIDGSDIYLTDQVRVSDFRHIEKLHIATIVDIRPDGEALDQTPSSEMAKICRQHGMDFAYIPVPHGDIPAPQVDKLAALLKVGRRPMLLYCRTGKRAIRTYCLAEASQDHGQTADELRIVAKKAGFNIDDLRDDIDRRISARKVKSQ